MAAKNQSKRVCGTRVETIRQKDGSRFFRAQDPESGIWIEKQIRFGGPVRKQVEDLLAELEDAVQEERRVKKQLGRGRGGD